MWQETTATIASASFLSVFARRGALIMRAREPAPMQSIVAVGGDGRAEPPTAREQLSMSHWAAPGESSAEVTPLEKCVESTFLAKTPFGQARNF